MSVAARIVSDIDCAACAGSGCGACGQSGHVAAGCFQWATDQHGAIDSLMYVCPCGCGVAMSVPVSRDGRVGWSWDGNETEPTLSPSILTSFEPSKQHWHGWLRCGQWVTA